MPEYTYKKMKSTKELLKQFIEIVPYDRFILTSIQDRHLLIKPKNAFHEVWLKIVVMFTGVDSYALQIDSTLAKTVILCICSDTKKMWLLPYKDVKDDRTVDVYHATYNKFLVFPYLVGDTLMDLYQDMA
jgi:hypothetical protein